MRLLKNKSVLKKYLITYVGVAVSACAILGVALMLISSHSLQRQETAAAEARLASACDDLIYQLDIMQELSYKPAAMMEYQPFYLQRNAYNEVIMLEHFSRLADSVIICDRYLLLYEDSSDIFTQQSKLPLSILLREIAPNWTETQFREALKGPNGFVVLDNVNRNGDRMLMRKYRITFSRSNGKSAYVIFLLDQAELSQRYGNLFRLSGDVLLQVNGQTILGDATQQATYQYAFNHQGEEILFAMTGDARDDLAASTRIMLYIVIGMSILFAVISIRLAWQSYDPIRSLASKMGVKDQTMNNEIQAIAMAVDDVIQQNTASMGALTKSLENVSRLQESLKQQILLLALSGEYDASLGKNMADAGMDLSGGHLCVAHIAWDEALNTDVLSRCISKVSDNDAKLHLAALAGKRGWALLLCAMDDANLLAAYDIVSEALTRAFPQLRIAQGGLCGDVQKLAWSLAVAESAQEKDLDAEHEGPQLTETLEKLKRCMEDGSEMQALACLDVLLDCVERECQSMLFRRYRLVDLTYQITNYGRSKGCAFETDEIKESLNYADADSVRAMLGGLVSKICAASPKAVAAQVPAASRVVIEYIEAHATDYDICLDSVAEACGISTKQVSRIARNVVDMSFKEYVSSLRMRRAMAMLKSGLSSTETAHEVGYSDISHFTKVFRAHTGVTPGKYREQMMEITEQEE